MFFVWKIECPNGHTHFSNDENVDFCPECDLVCRIHVCVDVSTQEQANKLIENPKDTA